MNNPKISLFFIHKCSDVNSKIFKKKIRKKNCVCLYTGNEIYSFQIKHLNIIIIVLGIQDNK